MSVRPDHTALESRRPTPADVLVHAAGDPGLLEALPFAVAVFDAEPVLVAHNARFLEAIGATVPLGTSAYDAFPSALGDLTGPIEDALAGHPATVRVSFRDRNGTRVMDATFAPFAGSGNTPGAVFIGSDVTERERLREDLARNVTQLTAIFDAVPESVRVYDADGRITHSNPQAQREHGRVPPQGLAEIWRRDRPRRLDGTSLFLHEHPTARALAGASVRGEVLRVDRTQTTGGQAVIEVNANPLRDGSGVVRGAVTVERDVTERTRLAEELEEQLRVGAALYAHVSTEAERLERMVEERSRELIELQEARARDKRLAAVGQLAAGVMHDVNNALNPIMAASYLLTLHAEDPAAVRDYAARILKAAETGAATAARVGRFIRQEPMQQGKEERLDLSVIADEVIAMTRPLWAERAQGGRITLHRTLVNGARAKGIAGEVREALLNLVNNALDAMHGGGALGVSTRVDGKWAIIEVRDTGTGMSAEVRERAFEPFFSTKGPGGSGLGLAEVYGVMKRHRGKVEIESEPGEGTLMRLRFPLVADVVTADMPVIPMKPEQRRILLVEDHEDGREFVTALLTSAGHVVHAVRDIASAQAKLDRAAAGAPEASYDVLVTDVGLPDGSGWTLVAEARARFPLLRIGVVTGWEPNVPDALDIDFILRKPIRTQDLLAHVGAPPRGASAADAPTQP